LGVSVVEKRKAPEVGADITESFLKLCRAARGEEGLEFDGAFREFHDASAAWVENTLKCILQGPQYHEDRADIAQDFFIKTRDPQFIKKWTANEESPPEVRGYLRNVLRNLAIDAVRRNKHLPYQAFTGLDLNQIELPEQRNHGREPHELFFANEINDDLESIVAELSKAQDQRSLRRLKILDVLLSGGDRNDLAQALDINNPSSVKGALREFRDWLAFKLGREVRQHLESRKERTRNKQAKPSHPTQSPASNEE
jgi:DNA-directed RNA polymerase specialized sigma24 family protein